MWLGVLNVRCKSLGFSIGDTAPVKVFGHVSNISNLHFKKTNPAVTKWIWQGWYWMKAGQPVKTELNGYKIMFLLSRIPKMIQPCTQRTFFLRVIQNHELISWHGAGQSVINVTHQCYWTGMSFINQNTMAMISLGANWGVGRQDWHVISYSPSCVLSLE